MHAVSHSLAHRPPTATRTRVRWQPYNSIPSCSRSTPSSSFLITPSSSVSPPPQSSKLFDPERIRRPSISSIHPTPIDSQFRDGSRSRYVIGLVDQAVKSLSEIWQPHDIPDVFVTSSRVTVTLPPPKNSSLRRSLSHHFRNTQLPSPESPNTSTFSPSTFTRPPSPPDSSRPIGGDQDAHNNLVPLKGFVHEVLRRSRTSGTVLQTALCYLEAIRQKVPELAKKEMAGEGLSGEESEGRVIMGEDLPDCEAEAMGMRMSLDSVIHTDICATPPVDFRVNLKGVSQQFPKSDGPDLVISSTPPPSSSPSLQDQPSVPELLTKKHNAPSAPLPPLPPLPSPLLCPRRAFLASLILASKFIQDRCYSNKAWAKLSGLPPREIGRCERALGDALEWRLWVGKIPAVSSASTSPSPNGRAVVRSRSEGDLFPKSPTRTTPTRPLMRRKTAELESHTPSRDARSKEALLTARSSAGLRRCATSAFDKPSPSATAVTSSTSPLLETLTAQTQEFAHVVAESFSQQWDRVSQSQSETSSPPTPSLTFSPESIESNSDGDRTIQISSFIDVSTPPNGYFAPETRKTKVHVVSDPTFMGASSIYFGYTPPDSNPSIYANAVPFNAVSASYLDPLDTAGVVYSY